MKKGEGEGMTTKDFCAVYGMSVNEMCEYLGLSRQGLNEIVKGHSTKRSKKKELASANLRRLSADLYNKEHAQATHNYLSRLEAIKIFEQY